jgi:hypothetical protein
MMPAVGDSAPFIAALTDLVLKSIGITEAKDALLAASSR